jgi:positive regulator of sigma E activity
MYITQGNIRTSKPKTAHNYLIMKNLIYFIITIFLLTINAQPIYLLNENNQALTMALALPMIGFLIMSDYEEHKENNTKKQIALVHTKSIKKSVKQFNYSTSSTCENNIL